MNLPNHSNASDRSLLQEAALQLFVDLIADSEGLEDEFLASRVHFRGSLDQDAGGDAVPDPGFERRHLEWFLFDRHSEVLGDNPAEVLEADWLEATEQSLDEVPVGLLRSVCGVFEVLELGADGAVLLQEVAALTKLEMVPTVEPNSCLPGDLLVGRLYPLQGGQHEPSAALGFFRSPKLLAALRMDLQRLREARAHAVMRLSQLELEHMFWGQQSPWSSSRQGDQPGRGASTVSNPVGEMERFFRGEGVSGEAVESWKRSLANTPPDPEQVVAGAGDLVSVLLDQLAFDTEVDLQKARTLLLAAWPVLVARQLESNSGAVQDQSSSLSREGVAESLVEFDRDRAAGIDVETSMRELERRLGLDSTETDDVGDAPDFPGVVGAMVEEFLWEQTLREGDSAGTQPWAEGLRLFAEYTSKIGVFENLGEREVLSFLTFWLPESKQLQDTEDARRMVSAVQAFAEWAAESHSVSIVGDNLAPEVEALKQSLARVVVANAQAEREPTSSGELFEYCGAGHGSLGRIRDEHGEEREVPLQESLVQVLEPGDLLRGYTAEEGHFVVGCCYPPQAKGLRQRLL